MLKYRLFGMFKYIVMCKVCIMYRDIFLKCIVSHHIYHLEVGTHP